MTYEEMNKLQKGERLQVLENGEWINGTFVSYINGADAAMWFAYDFRQKQPGSFIATKVYTGLQFTPEYWEQQYAGRRFRRITEEVLV